MNDSFSNRPDPHDNAQFNFTDEYPRLPVVFQVALGHIFIYSSQSCEVAIAVLTSEIRILLRGEIDLSARLS